MNSFICNAHGYLGSCKADTVPSEGGTRGMCRQAPKYQASSLRLVSTSFEFVLSSTIPHRLPRINRTRRLGISFLKIRGWLNVNSALSNQKTAADVDVQLTDSKGIENSHHVAKFYDGCAI